MIEPHLPPFRRLEVAIRRLFGENIAPGHMQYGATGPMVLNYYVQQRGLSGQVLPSSALYPIPYEGIPALLQPGPSVDAAIKPDTIAIHLWRSQLTNRGRTDMPLPPKGSAMAELCTREGVTFG